MKIPLLLHANPKRVKKGPKVALTAGQWSIEVENLDNSHVFLFYTPFPPDESFEGVRTTRLGKDPLGITGPSTVQVNIDIQGSEEHLSVFAEKIT